MLERKSFLLHRASSEVIDWESNPVSKRKNVTYSPLERTDYPKVSLKLAQQKDDVQSFFNLREFSIRNQLDSIFRDSSC